MSPFSMVSAPWTLAVCFAFAPSGCATEPGSHDEGMGTVTTLGAAKSANYTACAHKVPQEVCTQCHPELVPKFKAAHDWCGIHDVAESQCFACHPDLNFDPLPTLPEGADL